MKCFSVYKTVFSWQCYRFLNAENGLLKHTTSSYAKKFWIYITIMLSRFLILQLPEKDNKIIVINEHHGPAAVDIAGLILIIVSWVLMLNTSLKDYNKIRDTISVKWRCIF